MQINLSRTLLLDMRRVQGWIWISSARVWRVEGICRAFETMSAEASAEGIAETPAFILGKTSATVIEGIKLMGAQPYEVFEKALIEQSAR